MKTDNAIKQRHEIAHESTPSLPLSRTSVEEWLEAFFFFFFFYSKDYYLLEILTAYN